VTRLIVWRHGNTDWNAEGRVQGQSDVPLNDLGRQQAVDAAELLVAMRPTVIVSSDLRRAADTAAALGALTGLGVRVDPRLRERYFGPWQGLLMSEVAERNPAEFARWTQGADVIGDDIETLDDMGKRMVDAFTEAAALDPAGTVVVATHGASARQGVLQLLGWPHEQSRTFRALQNCHWVELTHDASRGWQVPAYNVGVFTDRPVPPPV
jgi:broad specificity phosphatase PhoE